MDNPRYLECLASDFARLRSVAQIDQAAPVPTCPDWTVAELTRHVGMVYLHKVAAMREGVEPDWPPPGMAEGEPFGVLDRGYADLLHELSTRKPTDPSGSWYSPDQTVGFWFRRMAQETVIHRIDAELATGQPPAPVPADLAIDGIDELLKVFVAYSVANWPSAFNEVLADSPARAYLVQTQGAAWRVRTSPGVFSVDNGPDEGAAEVTLSGTPEAVLRWVWNRESSSDPVQVEVRGPIAAVDVLKRCITIATQ